MNKFWFWWSAIWTVVLTTGAIIFLKDYPVAFGLWMWLGGANCMIVIDRGIKQWT